MPFNKFLEYLIILCLFIATLGTGYIFIVSIIFRDTTYAGFYSSWQFPMLLAIITDATYYKYIISLT